MDLLFYGENFKYSKLYKWFYDFLLVFVSFKLDKATKFKEFLKEKDLGF